MTPDFTVAEPWGSKFFRSEAEAVEYAQAHGLTAHRWDYEHALGFLPYRRGVPTVIYNPSLEQPRRGGNKPTGLLELSEEPEAA